ncbi:MAG TPA: DUF378 domain-containing protein [Polyangium sp.]|nr:DUF378 domain-containing protein [Polyangium sp.]
MVDTRTNELSGLTWAAVVLVIIGALNWALVGLFDWNLVAAMFGRLTAITRIVYVLVGAAGLYLVFVSPKLAQSHRP